MFLFLEDIRFLVLLSTGLPTNSLFFFFLRVLDAV